MSTKSLILDVSVQLTYFYLYPHQTLHYAAGHNYTIPCYISWEINILQKGKITPVMSDDSFQSLLLKYL